MKRVGICFSKEFSGTKPLDHIGVKLPVYIRLLEFCQKEGWEVYVLTRKTYKGDGIFEGAWLFNNGKFEKKDEAVKVDLVYDRTGGTKFPPVKDKLNVINRRDFKILCWDKWRAYAEIGKYMPKTVWVGGHENLETAISGVRTDWVVLKPYNGLKGIGVFIGPKNESRHFKFIGKNPKYIAQEFVDTSGGVPKIAEGLHDLRIAIVNGKAVWCHVRTPPKGTFAANVAQGGTLTEVDYDRIPNSVKKIVGIISESFYNNYDNPSYSLDFGIGKDGVPKIFEINDQIGFPLWGMKNRDNFLNELIKSFKVKLGAT